MQCINYAKREQEKPLLFKLTLRSRFRVSIKPGNARNTPLTGWIPRNTLNCKN